MQFTITTIEAKNTVAANVNFQVTVYEQKTTAFCDCCDNTSTGTKQELKNRGWGFGNGSEFCPECNY